MRIEERDGTGWDTAIPGVDSEDIKPGITYFMVDGIYDPNERMSYRDGKLIVEISEPGDPRYVAPKGSSARATAEAPLPALPTGLTANPNAIDKQGAPVHPAVDQPLVIIKAPVVADRKTEDGPDLDGTGYPFLHPLCARFPEIEGREAEEMLADVMSAKKIREMVVLIWHEGKLCILDGRNRYLMYRRAKQQGQEVSIRYMLWGTGDPLPWIKSRNLYRRNLSSVDRARLALVKAELPEASAPEGAPVHPEPKSETVEEAARGAGVSKRMVMQLRKIRKSGIPELISAVEVEKTIFAKTGEQIAYLPAEEQLAAIERAKDDPTAVVEEILKRKREVKGKTPNHILAKKFRALCKDIEAVFPRVQETLTSAVLEFLEKE